MKPLPVSLTRSSMIALTLATPVLLSGCFLQVRQLRDDNNMMRSEIVQLNQDLSATAGRLSTAQRNAEELRTERDRLQAEVENLRGRVETLQRVMDTSQRQTAESLMRDMEERVERENRLRLDLDESSAALEAAQNEKQLMENRLAGLQEELEQLKTSLESTTRRLEEANTLAANLRAERDDARAERDDYRRQTQALSADREDVASNLEEVSSELRDREKDLAALTRQVEELEQAAEARATRDAAEASANRERAGEIRSALRRALEGLEVAFVDGDEARLRASSDVFFDTGTVNLSAAGRTILDRVAQALDGKEFSRLRVEGHSDSTPVRAMPFVDNWDLSATRAATVARYLATEGGINGAKVSASSQSFYAPIASNETAVGRRENRRVEIVVLP